MTLLTATALGGDESLALEPACAVEMVHAASLILDDLPCMDNAEVRRGQPSTHLRYGQDVAILAAVALLNHAFAVIGQSPRLEPGASVRMVRALSGAIGLDGLVAGQESDLRREASLSMGALSTINRQKTAVLFGAAVELGAHAAGATPGQVEALRTFALELGLAFQAIDDLDDELLGEDEGLSTVVTVLGREGAKTEALLRLTAARRARRDGGERLAGLDPCIDLLVERVATRQ
jgi:geranylgeranyl diphosphate synthase type II